MRVCIFTGAGMGVPLQLPTTQGFQNTINKIEGPLLEFVNSFLNETDKNDIEKVLYLLEDFTRKDDFTSHIVRSGVGLNGFETVNSNLNAYRAMARKGIETIKSDIFEILDQCDYELSAELYSSIIKEIKFAFPDSSFSFFTTNYDLSFETGFAENEEKLTDIDVESIYYGFVERNGRSIYNPSQDFNWDPKIIEYLKLHGSLDWNKNNNGKCIRSGIATNPKEPGKMPLLYPGFKGIPSSQPFIDIHDRFYERVGQADIMFVLGFAFRDQYINSIFEFSLKRNKDLIVFCYNPCKKGEYPNDSSLEDFSKRFPDNFVHIPEPVENNSTPLNFNNLVNKDIKIMELLTKRMSKNSNKYPISGN